MSTFDKELDQAIAISKITHQHEIDLEIALNESVRMLEQAADTEYINALISSIPDMKEEREFKSAEEWWRMVSGVLANSETDNTDIPVKVEVVYGEAHYSIMCPICNRKCRLPNKRGFFRHAAFHYTDEATYLKIINSSMDEYFDSESLASRYMIPHSGCAAPFTSYIDEYGELKVSFGFSRP